MRCRFRRYSVFLALGAHCLPYVPTALAQDQPAPKREGVNSAAPDGEGSKVLGALDQPLSLTEAMLLALARHNDVAAARESLAAARQSVASAQSQNAPQVSGTVNADLGSGRVVSSGIPLSANTSTVGTGINVSQKIWDNGRVRTAVRQARANSVGELASLGGARTALVYEVASTFLEQLRQEQLVKQRTAQVSVARRQIEQIQARIAAGDAPRADLASVQVNLSQAQLDLVTAQNAARIAARRLRSALGLETGAPLVLETPPVTGEGQATLVPAKGEISQLEDEAVWVRRAQALRPDVLAAQASVEASRAAVQRARLDAGPSVSANAGYNLDPRETDDRRFTLGAALSVPLFNGGGLRAEVKAARLTLESNEIRLAQVRRDAETEVLNALEDIAGQRERVRNANALLEAARVNLETATARYEAGAGITLDISVAQNQFFEAQTSLTQAQFDYRLALAALDRAAGRYAWAGPGSDWPERVPGVDTAVR